MRCLFGHVDGSVELLSYSAAWNDRWLAAVDVLGGTDGYLRPRFGEEISAVHIGPIVARAAVAALAPWAKNAVPGLTVPH